ncbi:unnamed protein product [Lactuca virosa]|uniref:Uncharacterized protein n=1 Tax=Lactuca virosa TaxID=75947 RepID=A0AAU9LW98_9ASTR|nr:unnamed protein product [Lactuca virosa]
MKQRKVQVPAVVDWNWIEQTGLLEGLEPFLEKSFAGVHGPFICMGWRRLFQIQEVVYKELVVENLAIVSFRRKIGALEKKNITFCLKGERRELNLTDLALRTEIYLSSEVHTDYYMEFITGSIKLTEGFKAE